MTDKIYPKGLRTFPPHANAPDFVKGTLIITTNELVKFCAENPDLMTEYHGNQQLKCQILEGDKGLYFQVDTYRRDPNVSQEPQPEVDGNNSDLPF